MTSAYARKRSRMLRLTNRSTSRISAVSSASSCGKRVAPGQVTCLLVEHDMGVVMDISEDSDGNAVGMGQVDLVPERFARRIDRHVTQLNALTSCAPTAARLPVVLPDDREAFLTAIRTSPLRPEGPRVVYVRDTLALEDVLVSEACRPLVEDRDDIEIVSGPEVLHFDAQGRLHSPFDEGVRS